MAVITSYAGSRAVGVAEIQMQTAAAEAGIVSGSATMIGIGTEGRTWTEIETHGAAATAVAAQRGRTVAAPTAAGARDRRTLLPPGVSPLT